MFKNLASDALGLSDIGSIIDAKDYDKADSDDYILQEDGEKIYFIIKSKSDEYCFTNYALIHLDGSSATSKKRLLKRFNYKTHLITNVMLETAGTIDLDIELKFTIGGISYSIDIRKKDIDGLKNIYKTLLKISSIQHENERLYQYAENSLKTATSAIQRSSSASSAVEQFTSINEYSFQWLTQAYNRYMRKDFGEIFEKFIYKNQFCKPQETNDMFEEFIHK